MESGSEGVIERVEQVTTTGTSWIVRRSKSHGGQIYYFNTLTGEALWNLSEAEMERARRSTKKIPNQEDVNIGVCPEPKEPPYGQHRQSPTPNTEKGNPTTSHSPSSSRIYNKQIINNQFPKQQFPIAPFIVPSFMPNGFFPIAMDPSNANYTSNVYSVPPPMLFNPNLPVINHTQPNMEFNPKPSTSVHFNNQKDNMHVNGNTPDVSFNNITPFDDQEVSESICNPISPQPCRFQRIKSFNASSNKQQYKKKKYGQRKNNSKINLMNPDFDLRKLLSAKKLQKQIYSDNEEDSHHYSYTGALSENELEDPDTSNEIDEGALSEPDTGSAKEQHTEADDDWIEEHFFVKDGKIKLDVKNLKNLKQPYMDTERWYIVADKDFLLNHLNFLNILCNSDDECSLMVPRNVLAELQEAKDSPVRRIASRAKRAVSFLLQRSEGINVSIGDANCDETDTRCDYLLNCCDNLLEDNCHVVLLSNDEGFQSIKNTSQIPIFNIKELKQVLTNSLPVKKDRLKPPPSVTAKPIRITVTNDTVKKQTESVISDPGSEPAVSVDKHESLLRKCKEIQNNIQILHKDTHAKETNIQGNSQALTTDSLEKQTSETGVQTEVIETNVCHSSNIENVKSDDFKTVSLEKLEETNVCHSSNRENVKSDNIQTQSVTLESSKAPPTTPNSNKSGKRDIRLNRSISVKTTSEEETPTIEKKQFRWRRKRLASGSCPNDSKVSAAGTNKDGNSTQQKVTPTSAGSENKQNQAPNESLFSDLSSFKNKATTDEKVTVDETSTSGVISNVTSFVDSESDSGNVPTATVTEPLQVQNNVMFEVQDQNMENSLRIMKEEWLSRFSQIMEEVLTQVLRQDEKFLNEAVYKLCGGGPWSILEAANCIKIKFKDNCDIIDAADKLSRMLAKITDTTGRIIVNLEPSEYMEMYSYGVFLVKAMESALRNCEDLNIASQSLSKLLDDIRNPNLDTNQTDAFEDHVPKETPPKDKQSTLVSQSPKVKDKTPKPLPSPKKPKTPTKTVEKSPGTVGKQTSAGSYNLRSKQRTPNVSPQVKPRKLSPLQLTYVEQSKEQPVTFKRTINQPNVRSEQDSFFTHLNLVKKSSTNEESQNTTTAKTKYSHDTSKNIHEINKNHSDPPSRNFNNIRVVRNFTLCPEFKKGADDHEKPVQREPLDMDQLDYSGDETQDEYLAHDALEPEDQNFDHKDQNYDRYDQDLDRYDQNFDHYDQNFDNYDQNYDRNYLNFDDQNYNRNDQNFDHYDQNYDSSDQNFDRNNQNYDRSDENFDRNNQNYDRSDQNVHRYDQNLHRQIQNVDQINESRNEIVNNERPTERTLPQINGHSFFDDGINGNLRNDLPYKSIENLDFIFYPVITGVRESFLEIRIFCERTIEELRGTVTANRKFELLKKADRIQIKIQNLCETLNRIYYRDTFGSQNSMQALLNRAGINNSYFSENLDRKYRAVIGNCIEQAKVLQDSVVTIIRAVNNKAFKL